MSSKEKVKKWREKIRKNKEDFQAYLEKERERGKKNRELDKQKLAKNPTKLKLKRLQTAYRVKQWREKKKEAKRKNITDLHERGSYKTPQSLGKAVNRVKKLLPNSPTKKSAVVKKLLCDIFPGTTLYQRNKKIVPRLSQNDVVKVEEFFSRDDISRQAPGVRDTKSVKYRATGKRKLVQKRHMVMTVKEAFVLFLEENPDMKIKLSKFYELRPEHVLLSSQMPHNVCVCIYHANFNFIVESLHNKLKSDFPTSGSELLSMVCCDVDSELCMTGICNNCKDVESILPTENSSLDQVLVWKQWKDIEGRPKLVETEGTVEDAMNDLEGQLAVFKIHSFVKRVQSKDFQSRKKNIGANCCVLQVDYAENFNNISQDEIQSAHWSHDQISLFTCCAWMEDNSTRSFIVVSDCTTHDKFSVWACLKKVLHELKEEFPDLEMITVFSDGCAAQFKNKYTLSNLCFFRQDFNVDRGEWIFFATSHGKGAVDGIGGLTKRLVWNEVKSRRVMIMSASDFCRCVQKVSGTIKALLLTEEDIDASKKILSNRWMNVQPIQGLHSKHYFCGESDVKIIVARTSASVKETCCVFKEINVTHESDNSRSPNDDIKSLESHYLLEIQLIRT